MWFILESVVGTKFYVNSKYITDFCFNGVNTLVSVMSKGQIMVNGDVTKELINVIRMSGERFKQLGGQNDN